MSLRELFRNPTADYRQAPLWFWNHKLEKPVLEWQMDQLQEKGLGGFVMHARHGLITPYLSDEWFECIRFCCEKARERGLVAWAYDERAWPGGPAAGATIEDHGNRMHYIRAERSERQGPDELTASRDTVALFAAPKGETPRRVEAPYHIGGGAWDIVRIARFECPPILWFDSYLDTLSRKACRAFLRSTYDLHEQKLGDLGKLGLAGFFTDEPALSTYPDDLSRLPWTEELPRVFARRKGYDLLEKLPLLFEEGDAGALLRSDYWDVVTALFESAFFRLLSQWCEKRGLRFIGHPLGEEPLFYQFRCLGTIFRHLKHLHVPGMDQLTMTVGKETPFAMTPKMVESAALLAGRERTMTETFGESGWALTLREMKWIADWQIAHGINYFIPHAFYYSISRRRKRDSPPSEFFQAPFWPYYRRFADYTARVTSAMTGGEHVARVALFFPISSIWADFVPGEEVPPVVQEMERCFAPLGEKLLALHRDFVVLDEEHLAKARVAGGRFNVNGLEFEALVMPKFTTLGERTLGKVRRIAKACACVAVDVDEFRVIPRGKGTPPDGDCERVAADSIAGMRLLSSPSASELASALADVPQDVAMDSAPDVHYLHRRKEGLDLYFFANTGADAVDTTVSLGVTGRAEMWDPCTGEQREAPGQRVRHGRLELPLNLAPSGSALVAVDPAGEPREVPAVEFVPAQRIKLCELWAFSPENGNFVALKQWDMRTRMRHNTMELRYATRFIMPERIANLRLILDGIPARAYDIAEAVRPMMAGITDSRVLLDGDPVTGELPWEIDPEFRVLDLEKREPGTHLLEIVVRTNGWFPQPGLEEYVWLAGDFALDPEREVPCIVPIRGVRTGPWEQQGFPFFSGTANYFADISLSKEVMGKRVVLNAGRVGDLLGIEVNGRDCGVCAWPPYRADVSQLVCEGPNLFVLKVANSSRNLLEGPDPDHPSGLLEDVYLEVGG